MNSSTLAEHERPCPVCHCTTHVHFADEHIDLHQLSGLTYASRKTPEFMCLRLVQCTTCDLVYAPTPPAQDYLRDAYAQADFDSGTEALAAAKSYANALKPHVAKLSDRHAAIDVGAGSGPLLPWLQEQGFSPVVGIEPSRAAIDAAPPDVRPLLREGMFSPDMLEGIQPSLICSFMTLEHIADPRSFAEAAHDLLEAGGGFAVVVHNWRAPLNRLLGLRSPIIDIEHLQLFSPQSLLSLMEQSGFQAVEVQAIRNAYPLRYWLRLTPLPHTLKRLILRVLETMRLADRTLALNVGNMLAFGIKPRNQL
ncbi:MULTISPECIES: class I SAM-dependent methyltransferase [Hydrogenophaga]|uniref:Methyltransferase n=1 Tax=Hydrogenophaga intermedia TaxID=65786 RepID=A0A1L1PDV8_HYDIT|nr:MULTISPECIES: class I SAM-dependent methyltransferase [Hydrogenophaga]AOS81325.1 methyltransferase type 12 [Hydrogenophaga sp. PBC]TMU74215.1 class I SAM-dependent methyltransferase [Hydrogenophaga intermedia]CDN87700.1 Methyltransferase [Hydrogenophaga intermedia]